MMLLPILFAFSLPIQGDEVNREQFFRLLTSSYENYEDVSFVFEGESRRVSREPVDPDMPGFQDYKFQGAYAYREGGETLLELYRTLDDGSPYQYTKESMLDWEIYKTDQIPDRDTSAEYLDHWHGGPGSLSMPPSPESYVQIPYFDRFDDDGEFGYQFLGWEEVDGHRCLHVEIDGSPNNPNPGHAGRNYWFDIQRGVHPLKIETYNGGVLTKRVHGIRLEEFRADDGRRLWLPVTAKVDVFDIDGRPVTEETNTLVAGSTRINQGLTNDVFRIELQTDRTLSNAKLEGPRRQFLDRQIDPPVRTDPESVERRLNEQLEAAEAQAEQLDASQSARAEEGRGTLPVLKNAFLVLGVGLLAAAIFWRLRAR